MLAPNSTVGSTQVAVTTTAVRLDKDEADAVSGTETFAAKYGRSVWLTVGATDIYLGGDNSVRGSTQTLPLYRGRLAKAGTEVVIDLKGTDELWAITASGTSTCEVLVSGV